MSEQAAQQAAEQEAPAAVPVTFRVTTYWKRGRNEPGLTSMASQRLVISQALDWVLNELPDDAVTVTGDGNGCTVVIDWSRVPGAIRYGRR
jgi:hypothetical protein